jgi:hypothetical protein
MDKKTLELVNKVRESLGSLNNKDLFTKEDKKLEVLLECCKDLLIFMGYKVVSPSIPQMNVNKLDDLIELFYSYKAYYHPKEYNLGRMPIERDRAVAKHFVEGRMQNGTVSKNVALKQCAKIIETVFKYESDFKFKFSLTFGIFGQNKLGWVTEFALKIIEREKAKESEKKSEELIQDYESHYMEEEKDIPFNDLDELLGKIKSNV